MADEKWYSYGLERREAEGLNKVYARISKPRFGITDQDWLALTYELSFNGGLATDSITDASDIKELLRRTNACEVGRLCGKVVEAYFDDSRTLKGISVDENLV